LIKPVQGHLRGMIANCTSAWTVHFEYLPLAALHDGQRYLVQRYGLVMDDGIQVSAEARWPPPASRPPDRPHAAARQAGKQPCGWLPSAAPRPMPPTRHCPVSTPS
jgi:hypothetical protein